MGGLRVLICEPIRYDHGMGKIGGLGLVAVMALTGCTPSAGAAPVAQPVRVGIYKAMPEAEFSNFERRLCASLAAGNTVEDTVNVQANLFGTTAANDMRIVANSVRDTDCWRITP